MRLVRHDCNQPRCDSFIQLLTCPSHQWSLQQAVRLGTGRFLMKLSNESVVVELKNSTVVQARSVQCVCHRLPVTGMRGLGLKCEKREKTERTGHATTGKKRKQARIDNMFAV